MVKIENIRGDQQQQREESVSLFEKAIVTFFVLTSRLASGQAPKVTKEKSRKKAMLRTFFHARAQVISLLLQIRHLFSYFLFRGKLSSRRNALPVETAEVRRHCRRCIPTRILQHEEPLQVTSG
jgi:hypothetical protein